MFKNKNPQPKAGDRYNLIANILHAFHKGAQEM